MARTPETPDTADTPEGVPFTFLAAQGRLYARNPDGKTIDLGTLAAERDRWRWKLDGNDLAGEAGSAEAALRDAAQRMGFLWLDGQFTAVADAGTVNLQDAVRAEVVLDPLAGERMQDARV